MISSDGTTELGAPSVEVGGAGAVGQDDLWRPAQIADASAPTGPERLLLAQGHITADQLALAQKKMADEPKLSILEALVSIGAIDELRSLQAAASYFRLPFARVEPEEVSPDAYAMLPEKYLRNKVVLPVRWEEEAIVIAISDPADIFLIDDFRRRLKCPVNLLVTPSADIRKIIDDFSAGPSQHVDEIVRDFDEDTVEVVDTETDNDRDLEQMAGESPVIRYVNFLISNAATEGASDIHIEPGEKKLRVRFRMDGILFEQAAPPIQMHAAVISRLKIMANLDISERRLPQDGRIRVTVQRRSIDLRVSTLPTVHGEKCVIRLLDNRSISVGLENLGFSPEILGRFRHHILQPHGVVLVTGPTGSGKSTTLYSALQIMDRDKLNISTVEDPVEYELSGINQVNVHDTIGMSFSAALRSLLRQDPDIVMIGEVRDTETARIAVQASLTGHLVLSTLHTNDAPSSITRLINIGVEPFLISAAVNAILAQRLVRRICSECKEEVSLDSRIEGEYLKRMGYEGVTLFRGRGCDNCRQTGYKGRLGLYEFLELDEKIRVVIGSNPSITELKCFAVESGMKTLQQDGLDKVSQGRTTVEEVMRVTET